jgi:hypothetical protein
MSGRNTQAKEQCDCSALPTELPPLGVAVFYGANGSEAMSVLLNTNGTYFTYLNAETEGVLS